VFAVLYCHERLDGSGYPHGLKAEACRVLIEEAGTRLDSSAVAALFRALDDSAVGREPAARPALAV
jgi:HD-GYP domain-containing protein (c-di-GMP phosphodiesterase class II)